MKNKKFSLIAATIMTLLWTSQGYSLSEDTHQAINEYVAKNTVGGFSLTDYLINNLGFDGGATDEISGDANGVIISKSI